MNAHTFQPAPGDVQYLAQADLVILNSLHLEIPIEKLIRSSAKPGVTVLKLGEHTVSGPSGSLMPASPKPRACPIPSLAQR